MMFYENLHFITFNYASRVFSVRESGFGILYVFLREVHKMNMKWGSCK